jgi:Amt family ammonium transporter
VGSLTGVAVGFGGGLLIYGAIKLVMGLRLSQEDEYLGADLSIHKITAQPDYNRGDV